MSDSADCGCKYEGPLQVVSCCAHNVAAKNLDRAQVMLIESEMEVAKLRREVDKLSEVILLAIQGLSFLEPECRCNLKGSVREHGHISGCLVMVVREKLKEACASPR